MNLSQYQKPRNKTILIIGAPVSGKSTISYGLSIELGINQIIDTDIIRGIKVVQEPMNKYINTYSFKSWELFGKKQNKKNILLGYEKYSEQIEKEIFGVININDSLGRSMIIEGLHLHPKLIEKLIKINKLQMICLSVNSKEHKRNIINRLKNSHQQPRFYFDNFKAIRGINNFLVDCAKKYNFPIIENKNIKNTISSIIKVVNE